MYTPNQSDRCTTLSSSYTSSYFRCHHPLVVVVFLFPWSSWRGRRRFRGLLFIVLLLSQLLAGHVVVIVMGSGVIFSTSPPQLAFANKRGGMGDRGSFSLLSLPLLVVIVIGK